MILTKRYEQQKDCALVGAGNKWYMKKRIRVYKQYSNKGRDAEYEHARVKRTCLQRRKS